MKNLMKSAEVIGQVFGLVVGKNFNNPTTLMIERYPLVTQVIASSY